MFPFATRRTRAVCQTNEDLILTSWAKGDLKWLEAGVMGEMWFDVT